MGKWSVSNARMLWKMMLLVMAIGLWAFLIYTDLPLGMAVTVILAWDAI